MSQDGWVSQLIYAFKNYWYILIVLLILGGLSYMINSQNNMNEETQSKIDSVNKQVNTLGVDIEKLKEGFDEEAFVKSVKSNKANAKTFGEDIIEVDNKLTAYYKNDKPYPDVNNKKEVDKINKELDKYRSLNSSLRGAKKDTHLATWQLNPEWTLTLESVMTYQNVERFPIVFSMKTTDGEIAGIVYGEYDVSSNSMSSIRIQYTDAGIKDEASIGGI